MAVSVDDVLKATQFRSLSRAGRMTESLSSKTRENFRSKITKKKLELEDIEATAAAQGIDPALVAAQKRKPAVSPLKLLTAGEIADVDPDEIDKRVRASLPSDLVDADRVDALCSSGRDHPDVRAKSEAIVTLEKEIAFHSAMLEFHGGVHTAASRQSAEAAAAARMEADRVEAQRRAVALGLVTPAPNANTTAGESNNHNNNTVGSPDHLSKQMSFTQRTMNDTFGGASGGGTSPKNRNGRDATPKPLSMAQLVQKASPHTRAATPLSNPYAANKTSPAFAAKTKRFDDGTTTRTRATPPVGHYRPRHTIVEPTSPHRQFGKEKRQLNPSLPSPYIGDKLTEEERAAAYAEAAKSPQRRHGGGAGGTLERLPSSPSFLKGSQQFASGTYSSFAGGGKTLNGTTMLAGSAQAKAHLGATTTINNSTMAGGGLNHSVGVTSSAAASGGGVTAVASGAVNAAGSPASAIGSPPTVAPRASPCFMNRGRDAPVLTRGANTPEPGARRGDHHHHHHGSDSPSSPSSSMMKQQQQLSRRAASPGFANDSVVQRALPSAMVSFDRQISREQRDAALVDASAPRLSNTTTMPLRDGSKLHNRGGTAFNFDGYSSRDQRNRATETKPEQLAQRFYDRSALDSIRFSRPSTVDFGRVVSREQHRSGMPAESGHASTADSHVMSPDAPPVPEPPRKHTPGFDMTRGLTRPPIELAYHDSDVVYTPDDSYTKANPKHATINGGTGSPSRSRLANRSPSPTMSGGASPAGGGGGVRSSSPASKSARGNTTTHDVVYDDNGEPARRLYSHEELSSPLVRRKLAHDIDIGRQVPRDKKRRDGDDDEAGPAPIPHEALQKAYDYLSPAARGNPRIATHVSRAKRDAVAGGEKGVLTKDVDWRVAGDSHAMPNLHLGYVAFDKMTERDRHTGSYFANETRRIMRHFDKQSGDAAEAPTKASKRAAAHDDA